MQAQLEGAVAEPPPVLQANLAAVPMMVQAVLGTRKMSVQEIAELRPGSVIRTDSPAGGTVELRVNSVSFACGDVQIQDDRLSVQIAKVFIND